MKPPSRSATPWLALIRYGLSSNVLFAVVFTVVRYVHPVGAGYLDIIVLLAASVGPPALQRPVGALRVAILLVYNVSSNLYLAILIVYGVFGLAL